MLSPGDGVLAAVSGGPDSIALLHILDRLKGEFDLRLEVAHVDHGIRGRESKEDARFVAATADRLALPFHLKALDLPKLKAERGKGNLEALAREERYRFFTATAARRGLEKIATGHTRDDQAETVLMRLLRGSGRKGLGAMAPVSRRGDEIRLIRPLIETSREDVEKYLAAGKLKFRLDRTNLDPALVRNWVRLDLMPRLKKRLDRGLDLRLARMAEALRDEEEFLDGLARGLLPQIARGGSLLRGPLLEQPRAMQRRLVRLWLKDALGSLRGVDLDHVEAVLGLIFDGPPQGRVAIPGGLEAARLYDVLSLEKNGRARGAPRYSYPLPLGGAVVIPEAGMRLSSERGAPSGTRPAHDFEALFDAGALPETLVARNFRPGDRFQPLGMQGRRKLKDLFIEKKVPRGARAALPLLVAGENILWIPGCGRSRIGKIGPQTREVLKVTLSPLGAPAPGEESPEG
ncbi:MAG TPA: tRNA lysidine(34) synthetase TilS [Candidatus Binatia bacterium]